VLVDLSPEKIAGRMCLERLVVTVSTSMPSHLKNGGCSGSVNFLGINRLPNTLVVRFIFAKWYLSWQREIEEPQFVINTRPRKALNYLRPIEF
jgi:hypothetical protein